MIPFILVITLQNRKTLFCVFLSFRGLNEVKLSWDFSRMSIFHQEKHLEHLDLTRRATRAERAQVACPT